MSAFAPACADICRAPHAHVFLSEQRSDQTEFSTVDSPRVNMFFFAGIGGRLDVGGRRVTASQEVASR